MGQRKTNMISFDRSKLEKALAIRGLTVQKASLEMGFAKNYITKLCSRERMVKSSVILLEQLFGIKNDEIAPDNPGQTEPVANVHPERVEAVKPLVVDDISEEVWLKLYDVIKAAFSDALNG